MLFYYFSICLYLKEQFLEPNSIPLSLSINQSSFTGSNSCAYSCELTPICGYSCWSDFGSYLFHFVGVKFQIFGTYDINHGNISIFLDDVYLTDINQRGSRTQRVAQYTSDVLQYKNHTVRISGKGETFEIYKLTYWPSISAKRINITEFKPNGIFTTEGDGIGGLNQYSDGYSSKSLNIIATKFWISGSFANWLRSAKIKFGDFEDEFDEYIAYPINFHDRNRIVYESPTFSLENRTLTITLEGTVVLSCIFYTDEIPQPTQTSSKSSSMTPTESESPTETPTKLPTETQSKFQTETPTKLQTETQSKLQTETQSKLQTESPTKLQTETQFKSNQISDVKSVTFSNSFEYSTIKSSSMSELLISSEFGGSQNSDSDFVGSNKDQKKNKFATKETICLLVISVEMIMIIVIIVVLLVVIIRNRANASQRFIEIP